MQQDIVNKTNINKENVANVLIADCDPESVRFMLAILARKGIRGQDGEDRAAGCLIKDGI